MTGIDTDLPQHLTTASEEEELLDNDTTLQLIANDVLADAHVEYRRRSLLYSLRCAPSEDIGTIVNSTPKKGGTGC